MCNSATPGKIRQIYIPENLIFPDKDIFRHYREDALYVCHLLYRERIFKKRGRDEFQPLKLEYLRRQINFDAASEIMRALIASGIIESDKHYIIGKKAIGYRLSENLRRSKHTKFTLTDRALLHRLNKWYAGENTFTSDLPVHLALEQNLERLTIDAESAIEDIEDHYDRTVESLRGLDSKRATKHRKHARLKRNCELHAVDAWTNGATWFVVDRFGRVHTPLTSLSSRLRRHIVNLDGSELVEIDVVNSQPLILAALSMQWFRNKRKSFTLVEEPFDLVADFQQFLLANYADHSSNNLNSLPSSTPPPRSLYDVENRIELPSDVREFVQLCESGRLYDQIGEGSERKKAKEIFFKTIFGRCTPAKWNEQFPNIGAAVHFAKEDCSRQIYTGWRRRGVPGNS